MLTFTRHTDAPAPSDADLDALLAAATALAPHSRDRFDLLVEMGTTAPELAAVFGLADAVFGLPAERTQAAA